MVQRGGSCGTENIIYGLRCKMCDKWYVGESGNTLRGRLNGHWATVKKLLKGETLNTQMNDTGAAEHFAKMDHNFERDLELYLLEAGDWGSEVERQKVCNIGTKRYEQIYRGSQ